MESVWLVAGIFSLATLIAEVALWRLFSRRAASLILARELDASSFGLWTMGRLRMFAIIHLVFILISINAFLALVW